MVGELWRRVGVARATSLDSGPMNVEYKVVEIREGLLGGKMSGEKLEKTLNKYAQEGWRYKSMTAVDIKGRIGPGGVDGVLIVFEREAS